MPKFHVDLGDPPVEEMPPPPPHQLGRARAFKRFKSLKKAVRWAKEEYRNGAMPKRPDVVDDNGDKVEIDWDSAAWLTHEELVGRLNVAETSRSSARKTIEKMTEDQMARDLAMIQAGYIPVRVLTPYLADMRRDINRGDSSRYSHPLDFAMMGTDKYTITLQATLGGNTTLLHAAMTALSEGRIK